MEIINYREINKGCVKCSFTIHIPEWGDQEIDAVYFEKDNGDFWINYAEKSYETREGKKKIYSQIRWPKSVSNKLNESIREKIYAGNFKRNER